MEAHVADWKKERVGDLEELSGKYNVIGVVDTKGIPAPIIQKMRADIREYGRLVVMKKTLINHFLKNIESNNDGVTKLQEFVETCTLPGIILADMDSFKLFRTFEDGKKLAPARGGETAPNDIKVFKGETSFKPGPIISEFGKAGIPAAIDKGKVVIKKDTLLVKQGETIPREVAIMITKLEIFPITLGIDFKGSFEDGIVFDKGVLNVDMDAFSGQLHGAISAAFNLAMNIAYTTPATMTPLVQKAYMDAMALSVNIGYLTKENAEIIVQKAYAEALSLAGVLSPDAVDEEIQASLGAQAQAATAAPSTKADENKEEKENEPEEEEEEVSEDEAAAGLGALFG